MADAEFDSKEVEGIKKFRERILDWAESRLQKTRSQLAMNYLDDSTLWRYCLAHDFDLDKAEDMFKESVVWKEDIVKINELYTEWRGINVSPGTETIAVQRKPTSRRSLLGEKVFYGGLLGAKSITGGPVLVERLGAVDFDGLSKNPEALDALFNSYILYIEESWRQLRQTGGKVRGTYIIDLHGLGFSVLRHMDFVKRVTGLMVPNYPEVTEKVVIVRGPYFMSAIWRLIQPLLPTRTRNKVKMFGKNYLEQLGELVEGGVDALPTFLGGQSDDHTVCPTLSVREALATVDVIESI